MGQKELGDLLVGEYAKIIENSLERIECFEEQLDNNEDVMFKHITENNWHGLRMFLAGLKDELIGECD